MNELKCKDCGATLAEGTTVCPSCGSPTNSYVKPQPIQTMSAPRKKEFNVGAIISLLIGVVIVIFGVIIMNQDADISTHSARYDTHLALPYDIINYSFGADFYTEMYEASNTIVDELDDINKGLGIVSKGIASVDSGVSNISYATKELADIINYAAGVITIAVGMGVVAVSCIHMSKKKYSD